MTEQTSTVQFSCACGKEIRARVDQGGRSYTCPDCGEPVRIPRVAIADQLAPAPTQAPHRSFGSRLSATWKSRRAPATFGELLACLMGVWAAVGLLALIFSLFSVYTKYAALAVFLVVTAVTCQEIWKLMRARQRVLTAKDVPLLWGFARLVAWDPVEGVLILRNKNVLFSDDNLQDGCGGVRFLYPILGEELALRVPLEVQTLSFRDENVMTREYLSVTIHGTMKWRIVDIRKFYLFVSRELRSTTDHGDRVTLTTSERSLPATGATAGGSTISRLVVAAIEWMRVLAEEQTRIVVSRANSGLLIADRLSQELGNAAQMQAGTGLPDGTVAHAAPGEWVGGADGLAALIHNTIATRLEGFGIAVNDVSLQEIKLPEEILQECIRACKAHYYPAIATREASFEGAKLQAQANVIGRDALATKEIVHNAPAYGITDFVTKYLQQRLSTPGNAGMAAAVAALASQETQLAKKTS